MIGRSKDTYIAGLHIPIYHKNGVTKYLRTFCLSTQSVSRWTGLKCIIMWHHMQRLNNCYNTKMTKYTIAKLASAHLPVHKSVTCYTRKHTRVEILAGVMKMKCADNGDFAASHPRREKNRVVTFSGELLTRTPRSIIGRNISWDSIIRPKVKLEISHTFQTHENHYPWDSVYNVHCFNFKIWQSSCR